jgi:tetratricopeptide (TPR) repeat protein
MMDSDHRSIAAWLRHSRSAAADLGSEPEQINEEAKSLLAALLAGRPCALPQNDPPERKIEILHALVAAATQLSEPLPLKTLEAVRALVESIETLIWSVHRDFLLSQLVLAGWRRARLSGELENTAIWRTRAARLICRPSVGLSTSELGVIAARAEQLLSTPFALRRSRFRDFELRNSELLVAVAQRLHQRAEWEPQQIRTEAESFFRLLESHDLEANGSADKDFLLGEFALLVGSCSRLLGRWEDAQRWLSMAETFFCRCGGAASLSVRVAYQRLALAAEQRRLGVVLEKAPEVAEQAARLGMVEENLKCRTIAALAFTETGQYEEAITRLEEIRKEAIEASNPRLTGIAATNLALAYAELGRLDEALDAIKEATPLQLGSGSQIGLMKLRWFMGGVLQRQGKTEEALDTYRTARLTAERLGIRCDVAALHLVAANLLLDSGLDAEAESEVRAALPIIDDLGMVPEGVAALSLLRESLRRRKLDRNAIRTLHVHLRG